MRDRLYENLVPPSEDEEEPNSDTKLGRGEQEWEHITDRTDKIENLVSQQVKDGMVSYAM